MVSIVDNTFASIDWMMSLEATLVSTIYGVRL